MKRLAEAPEELRFRDYQPRDFPRLCELDRLCFPPGIAYDPQEIAAALLQPRTFCIVAEHKERVVGFVLAHARRGTGHIITIDLHPDIRRRGVGSRLMELAELRMRQHGARRATLEVAADNEAAMAFYRARGYGVQRLLRRYYRNGTDAYLMEKPL
ncbi:MAG TPA: ribosomal protein S18-alanine N-acetyltransferase [Terriglobia bacterium]|nr:ribosomal protein S18-alanine N-acetyltransferase [Terriglobia bacterium]